MAIRVSAGNNVYFDGAFVPEGEVLPRLYQLAQANPNIKVSLSAEEQALHGDVITVLDHIRSAGITKIGYQIKAAAPH